VDTLCIFVGPHAVIWLLIICVRTANASSGRNVCATQLEDRPELPAKIALLGQTENVNGVTGYNRDVLFAILAPIRHRIGVRKLGELGHP